MDCFLCWTVFLSLFQINFAYRASLLSYVNSLNFATRLTEHSDLIGWTEPSDLRRFRDIFSFLKMNGNRIKN